MIINPFIAGVARLPLWGGSGLKYKKRAIRFMGSSSPSLGREWIEMGNYP